MLSKAVQHLFVVVVVVVVIFQNVNTKDGKLDYQQEFLLVRLFGPCICACVCGVQQR